jgi:hypothetical protein
MKIKCYCSLLILFFTTIYSANGYGQITAMTDKYSYEFSDAPVRLSDGGWLGLFSSEENAKKKTLRDSKNGLLFKKWDADLNLDDKKHLAGGRSIYGSGFSQLIKVGDKTWLLYFEPGESKGSDLLAAEVDQASLEKGSPKSIVAKDQMSFGIPENFYASPFKFKPINVQVSPDQKMVAVFMAKGTNEMVITVLTHDMEKLWNRIETISKIHNGEIQSSTVDNDGKVYLTYKHKSNYGINVYSKSGSEGTIAFAMGEMEPKDILLKATKKGVFVSGVYFKDSKKCDGVYLGMINPSRKSVQALKTYSFPEEFLEALNSDYWGFTKGKKQGVSPDLELNLVEFENGDMNLTGEFRTLVGGGQASVSTHAGNLINIRFKQGQPVFTRIPKTSVHLGTGLSNQYTAWIMGDSIVYYYFDNSDNLQKDLNAGSKTSAKNTVMVAATIDPDGKVTRKTVSNLFQ